MRAPKPQTARLPKAAALAAAINAAVTAAMPPGIPIALAAALSLSACVNLAPENSRPQSPVPAALPVSGAAGGTAAPAPGVQPLPAWQDLVRDERLRRVVARVLASNRDLRVALLTVERSRALAQISDADRWPTLSAALTGDRAPNTSGVQTSTFKAGLQLSSYEIDLFDRLKNSSDAAAANLLATAASARSARLSMLTQAVGSWITLAADEEQLALAQRTLKAREQAEALSALRAKVGAASDLELRSVQTLTAQARATLAQLQRQRALDLNALHLLVGEPLPEAELPGPQALSETAWLAPVPVGVSADVLLARPDVIAAEQSLYAANASIGAARAAYFPRISLSGSLGQVSNELSGLVNAGKSAWTLSTSALLAIFDAGRIRAGVEVAKVNREIAVAQYEKAVQTAFLEAANGLQGQTAWVQQVAAQRALLDAERDRHRLTALRLQAGAAGLIDMLDAERSLASAEQALVQARLGESLNRLALYKALGGEAAAGSERP